MSSGIINTDKEQAIYITPNLKFRIVFRVLEWRHF